MAPPSPPEGRGAVAGGEAAESLLHKADPGARRNLLLVVLAGAAVLYALYWWFQGYTEDLPMVSDENLRDSTQDVIDEFVRVLYGAACLLAILAAYWFRLAQTIASAAQYPLPQMRLFHDMRILRGEAKRKYVRRMRYSAGIALALALLLLGAAVEMPLSVVRQHPALFQQGAAAARKP